MSTTTDAFPVRFATEDDLPEMVALGREALGGPLQSLAFWRWKHFDNPFGPSCIALAHAPDGTLAAMRAWLRWQWRQDGQILDALRPGDTATREAYRRRGLGRQLNTTLLEAARDAGVPLVYNTPNALSLGLNLQAGASVVQQVPIRVFPLRPVRAATRFVRARISPPAATHDFDDDGSLDEALRSPALAALLSATGGHRLHTPWTPELLRWRFLEVPTLTYRARMAAEGSDVALVIARRRARAGLSELMISTVLMTPTPRGVMLARKQLMAMCADSNADYAIASAPPDSDAAKVLRASLFVTAPVGGPTLVSQPLCPLIPDVTDPAAWALQVADLELF